MKTCFFCKKQGLALVPILAPRAGLVFACRTHPGVEDLYREYQATIVAEGESHEET